MCINICLKHEAIPEVYKPNQSLKWLICENLIILKTSSRQIMQNLLYIPNISVLSAKTKINHTNNIPFSLNFQHLWIHCNSNFILKLQDALMHMEHSLKKMSHIRTFNCYVKRIVVQSTFALVKLVVPGFKLTDCKQMFISFPLIEWFGDVMDLTVIAHKIPTNAVNQIIEQLMASTV